MSMQAGIIIAPATYLTQMLGKCQKIQDLLFQTAEELRLVKTVAGKAAPTTQSALDKNVVVTRQLTGSDARTKNRE